MKNLHHRDRSPPCGLMSWPLILVLSEDDCDSHMANAHADPSSNHYWLSAQFVDIEDRGDGGDEHDNTYDARGEQAGGVARCTQRGKDRRCVIED